MCTHSHTYTCNVYITHHCYETKKFLIIILLSHEYATVSYLLTIHKRSSFVLCNYCKLQDRPLPTLSRLFRERVCTRRRDKRPSRKKRIAIFAGNLLRFDLSIRATSAPLGTDIFRHRGDNIRVFFRIDRQNGSSFSSFFAFEASSKLIAEKINVIWKFTFS